MSSAKKYLGRFASLVAAAAMVWLCILPVSASENIPLLDWSWGYYLNSNPSATTLPTTFIPRSADTVFNGNAGRVVMYGFGIPAESGYTYTFTNTFQLRGSSSAPNLCSGNVLSTLGYSYSPFGTTMITFSGKLQNALVSLSRDVDGNCKLKVVFNTDSSGLTPGDIYLFANMFYYSDRSGGSTIGATVGNEILVCLKDLDGTKFEQILVDEIANMRSSQDEFYSNALEVLDQIKANGDEANTKLDQMPGKIGEELDKHDEKVKSESNTDGEAKVGQAKDALSAILPVSSIKDAITPLITACAYTGTTSVWTLPAIKLPSISGVMSETTLSEPINFDLASYVTQYVPPNILQLVQYLCTLGLIIFAIKEIISLIKEVFGGD